ncbi:MAG: hypothetical protein H7318_09745 [Oligoflexus sp.]|nr:hypothetical protein [Oligoflexus sp.]
MSVLKIAVDEEFQKKIEEKAFNKQMSLEDFIKSSLESDRNFSVPEGAKVVKSIPGYTFIHEVDGRILFKETGADAVSAYVGMTSGNETPELAASEVGESLAAMLEACHYCESGRFDYAAYRKR